MAYSSPSYYIIGTFQAQPFDYTPRWGRGNPNSFIDNVTFSKVLTDKPYRYRIIQGGWENGKDLGVRSANSISANGSQTVNLLEWNSGYGIADRNSISVYLVDPDNGNQTLVAQWN